MIVSKQGPDFHASTFGVSIQSGRSYRTVQRHIDRLCDLKILKLKHDANKYVNGSIRRTATYVLHEEAGEYLAPSETYQQWKDRNRRAAMPRRKGPQPVGNPSAPPAPEPQTPTQAVAVPIPAPVADRRPLRRLTPREGPKLVSAMAELMRGYTRHRQLDGYSFDLQPDDRRYRAPMTQDKALIAACMALGIPLESAIEHLKLCQWKFEESEPSA